MIVDRAIPPEIISKLGKEYVISGGTIRVASGYPNAGSIVRHLRFPEDPQSAGKVLQELQQMVSKNQEAMTGISQTLQQNQLALQGIQSLQYATLALQGANLAVSAVGFALVINKLNKIHQQLNRMDAKLDQLQMSVEEISQYQQIVQMTRYRANLDNLSSGLRLQDNVMISNAIGNLRESQYLFQTISEKELKNLQAVYQNPVFFQAHIDAAVCSALCIANTHAQLGKLMESQHVIEQLDIWQKQIKCKLLQPLEKKVKPVWLGDLTEEEKSQTKETLRYQKALPENLLYLHDTYKMCHDQNIDFQQLVTKDKDELLLFAA